ncbi:hypothetical protein RAS1_17920 [Phycisphaerae bacterium RAS1]|nr:hypothetical protein RAS1_17920 [Phycisphaerae bacterium RAS1]
MFLLDVLFEVLVFVLTGFLSQFLPATQIMLV